jgi:hypothetical protein
MVAKVAQVSGEGRSERRAHPLRLAQRLLVANCPVCALRRKAVLLGAGILAGVVTVPVKTPSVVDGVFAGEDRTGRDERQGDNDGFGGHCRFAGCSESGPSPPGRKRPVRAGTGSVGACLRFNYYPEKETIPFLFLSLRRSSDDGSRSQPKAAEISMNILDVKLGCCRGMCSTSSSSLRA